MRATSWPIRSSRRSAPSTRSSTRISARCGCRAAVPAVRRRRRVIRVHRPGARRRHRRSCASSATTPSEIAALRADGGRIAMSVPLYRCSTCPATAPTGRQGARLGGRRGDHRPRGRRRADAKAEARRATAALLHGAVPPAPGPRSTRREPPGTTPTSRWSRRCPAPSVCACRRSSPSTRCVTSRRRPPDRAAPPARRVRARASSAPSRSPRPPPRWRRSGWARRTCEPTSA